MHLDELQIFSLKIALIGIVPFFLIFRFCSIKYALCIFFIILIIAMISFFNREIAKTIKSKSSSIAHSCGNFISYTILTIIFTFVVIPTKLLMKITKRDRLKIREQDRETYWSEYNKNNQDYELQY